MHRSITSAGRSGRLEDALELFNSMPNLGFKRDLKAYNNLIWAAGNCGREDLSLEFYRDLIDKAHFKPNIYTYGALMHAFAKSKNHQKAMQLLQQMKHDHIRPNHVILSTAMEACAEASQHQAALSILHMARYDYNMEPDMTMMNTAIKACCIVKDLDTAEQLAK
jgi:pentatricopeptide repeat protein